MPWPALRSPERLPPLPPSKRCLQEAGEFDYPRESSYSGGGYGGGGFSSPGTSYGRGYMAPSVGGPTIYYSPGPRIISPPVIVSPYPAPLVPFGSGVAVTTQTAAPGFDAFDAVLLAGLGFIAFSTVASSLTAASRAGGFLGDTDYDAGGPLAVTKLQVGLLAVARELKGDLDAIAEAADTSSNEGLAALLQEAVLALLRNPDYCAYAAAAQKAAPGPAALERAFNAASLGERSKFESETLVNVIGGGGVRRGALKPGAAAAAAAQPEELIVVTLLVASRGGVKLPARLDSLADLRSALKALGALRAEQVLGVELVWTPQADGDSFSRDELARDYPDMRVL